MKPKDKHPAGEQSGRPHTLAEYQRLFWASLIDSEVTSSGDVPGFAEYVAGLPAGADARLRRIALLGWQSVKSVGWSRPAMDARVDEARHVVLEMRRGGTGEFAVRLDEHGFPVIGGQGITADEAEGLRALRELYVDSWDQDRSPLETLPLLEVLIRRWPWMDVEREALEKMGDRWRNANGEAYFDKEASSGA